MGEMSEFFEEYTHIVAESTKTWPYFDIPGCLKMLPWSVDECYGRIAPQWITKEGLTRHAVVQLALYTCPPFIDGARAKYPCPRTSAAEGYIIDQVTLKNGEKKDRKYSCHDVKSPVQALATALIDYEIACEQGNWWPYFERDRDRAITFLENFSWVVKDLRRRGITCNDPVLQHNRWLDKTILKLIQAVHAFRYEDYRRTYNPTNEPGDPRAHSRKWNLLRQMNEAFCSHMPPEWSEEASYRALAAIINQMQIWNAQGKPWTPAAVKRLLKRGPDPRLTLTIHLTRPNVVPWYTRPE
jgi:hypothetical protein